MVIIVNMYIVTFILIDDERTVKVKGKTVIIQGDGNSTECMRIIETFMKPAPDFLCFPKPCTIGGIYAPPIPEINFVALGNIYATSVELGVLNETGDLDLLLLLSRASFYCTKVRSIINFFFQIIKKMYSLRIFYNIYSWAEYIFKKRWTNNKNCKGVNTSK